MNAAIEAAHAGEAGKGFAVVAAEIKNMTGAINEIKRVSNDNAQSMNNIFIKLAEMNYSFASIKKTIEMQSGNSGQIMEALKKIRGVADEIGKDSVKIKDDSSVIFNAVSDLDSASNEVSSSANAAQKASRQIAASFSMAKKIVDGKIMIRPSLEKQTDKVHK